MREPERKISIAKDEMVTAIINLPFSPDDAIFRWLNKRAKNDLTYGTSLYLRQSPPGQFVPDQVPEGLERTPFHKHRSGWEVYYDHPKYIYLGEMPWEKEAETIVLESTAGRFSRLKERVSPFPGFKGEGFFTYLPKHYDLVEALMGFKGEPGENGVGKWQAVVRIESVSESRLHFDALATLAIGNVDPLRKNGLENWFNNLTRAAA